MQDEKAVEKLIELIDKIENYCNGASYESFTEDEMLVEACVFNLVQLGETSHKVSEDFEKHHSEIAWREINGLRNRLVHDYSGVNLKLIWEIIKDDLPKLRGQLENL